ncbi:unnamed protein product [Trichogramma brassicae]|uniref:Uncharacterized protein n=1 Tax=Trichogramma brassicae TaxID=86971 RepID=A0A6H5IJU5_9HYME|nr:unnamed protein product [Trichogramma brassicae]
MFFEKSCLILYLLHKMDLEYKFKNMVDEKKRNKWIHEQLKDFVDTHQICIEQCAYNDVYRDTGYVPSSSTICVQGLNTQRNERHARIRELLHYTERRRRGKEKMQRLYSAVERRASPRSCCAIIRSKHNDDDDDNKKTRQVQSRESSHVNRRPRDVPLLSSGRPVRDDMRAMTTGTFTLAARRADTDSRCANTHAKLVSCALERLGGRGVLQERRRDTAAAADRRSGQSGPDTAATGRGESDAARRRSSPGSRRRSVQLRFSHREGLRRGSSLSELYYGE